MQFDFHFHLLFKHAITLNQPEDQNIELGNFIDILDLVMGGPFNSQSSPKQVLSSPLFCGVISLLAMERAFAERMLKIPGFSLEKQLPLNGKMISQIKNGTTTYNHLFITQLDFTLGTIEKNPAWKINILNRSQTDQLNKMLEAQMKSTGSGKLLEERFFALSIEGGHNLCEVSIGGNAIHHTPEITLKGLQDRDDVDFISLNLCHLSNIPEQQLASFAQGLNQKAQKAFVSAEFFPRGGKGITPLGKKVVYQALTHPKKPIVIDVKHMSLYSRLEYYKYKDELGNKSAEVRRLPIISSHTGFTFNKVATYIGEREYELETGIETSSGIPYTRIFPREKKVGRTDDWINSGLYCNPWSIGLFDEEIVEIFRSNGLIGISLDQRVLGTEEMYIDSRRQKFYEEEYLSGEEYKSLASEYAVAKTEGLRDLLRKITPPLPRERHSMLFALHLVHAVRVGLDAGIVGNANDKDSSPWDYLCVGSDYDGLINPLNSLPDVTKIGRLRSELRKYLPQADKTHPFYATEKALKYTSSGNVDLDFLDNVIEKVLFSNGFRFLSRFMNNWKESE